MRLDRRILQHDGVRHVVDRGKLLVRHRLRMRKIEAQPVRRDKRAFLRDMAAERRAQRRVQKMRGGMVRADGAAAGRIDREPHGLPRHEAADLDLAEMHEEAVRLLLRVGDAEARAVLRLDRADVADLAARLAIERRLVDDDRAVLAFAERFHFLAVLDQRLDHRLGAVAVVAEKLRRAVAVAQREPYAFGRRLARPGPRRARLGPLPLHGVGEAR